MADRARDIAARVAEAAATGTPLTISAGGSKRHLLGRECAGDDLDVSAHRGIVDYQPSELVLTARAGTPLPEITAALAAQGQVLPFEPPLFGGRATLGGTVACNLSGPARPWQGATRDLVLGVRLVSGRGELLSFGGQVMKNVAGYDVSRLQAGALGTLGVLCDISLKVLPLPEHSLGLCYEMNAAQAIDTMNRRAGQAAPLSGACWLDNRLYLRLSGAAAAVEHTARRWGGDIQADHEEFWRRLRDMELPFFQGPEPLWRLSVAATAAADLAPGPTLIDWGGAQRWLRGEHELHALQAAASRAGGHAGLWAGGDRRGEVRPPPDPVTRALQQRLKASFDPRGILNPGRIHEWL